MSSILDALEKLETTHGPQPSRGAPEPRRPWRVIALVLVAVALGAGGAILVFGQRRTVDAPAAPEVVAQPPATTPAPTASATTLAVVAAAPTPPPTAVAATPQPPPPIPAAPVAARAAAPVPPPTSDLRERPWGAEPEAPKTPPPTTATAVAVARPAPAPPPPPPAPAAPRAIVDEPPAPTTKAPSGAPRLRVSFLVYSSVAERRSVALTFDGGGLTTLREGDESNGVTVVRIRPDRVDLRWDGQPFTLEVRS